MKLVARVAVKYEKWNHRIRVVIGEWKWHTLVQRDFTLLSAIATCERLYYVDIMEYLCIVMNENDNYVVYGGRMSYLKILDDRIRPIMMSFHKMPSRKKLHAKCTRFFENNYFEVYYFEKKELVFYNPYFAIYPSSILSSLLIIKK